MWCSGPIWGGWYVPWGMFLMPLFFMAIVFLFFAFWRRQSFHGYLGHSNVQGNNSELTEEMRQLRQEIEKLRLANQQQKP